jgi:hypothetical protein
MGTKAVKIKRTLGISLVLFFLSSATAFGVYVNRLPTTPIADKGFPGVLDYVNQASLWLFGILSAAAVIFLIYAAFLFLTSGGDEEKTKSAKHYMIYAVVALAVGILSWSIVILVGSFFDQGRTVTPPAGSGPDYCSTDFDCQILSPPGQTCEGGVCVY